MSDPSPVVRIRALEAFRRTVGLEGGGVSVNVNNVNQAAFIQDGKVRSFEQALQRVRDMHEKAQAEPKTIATTISSSATALREANSGDVEEP